VAWGVVSLYLLIAIQVSSWLRARMPRRWWRRIHFLSYPTLWMVTMHGLKAGTDAGRPLVRWGVIALVSAVAFVTFWRVFTVAPRRRRSDQVDTLTPDETQLEIDGAGDDRRARVDGVRTG
jgi:DMSO/TMAO reductase YedYZ heme-binding membrane subunit